MVRVCLLLGLLENIARRAARNTTLLTGPCKEIHSTGVTVTLSFISRDCVLFTLLLATNACPQPRHGLLGLLLFGRL